MTNFSSILESVSSIKKFLTQKCNYILYNNILGVTMNKKKIISKHEHGKRRNKKKTTLIF